MISSARRRWSIEPFTTVEGDHGPELGQGSQLSLDARVLLYIERTPGQSGSAVAKAVGGRRADVLDAIKAFELRGAVENRGTQSRPEYHVVPSQMRLEVAS